MGPFDPSRKRKKKFSGRPVPRKGERLTGKDRERECRKTREALFAFVARKGLDAIVMASWSDTLDLIPGRICVRCFDCLYETDYETLTALLEDFGDGFILVHESVVVNEQAVRFHDLTPRDAWLGFLTKAGRREEVKIANARLADVRPYFD